MSNKGIADAGGAEQKPPAANFRRLLEVSLAGHAIGAAVVVGFFAVLLGLPVRRLWAPYLALLECGLVLAPFLYWAHLPRDQPKSRASRYAIAMFVYLQVVAVALTFGATWAGILSPSGAVDYAPLWLPFSALICVLIYVLARQVFKEIQRVS